LKNKLNLFSKLYGNNDLFRRALKEMMSRPDIFVVDDTDVCEQPCLTCDQRTTQSGQVYLSLNDSHFDRMKNVQVDLQPVNIKMKNVRVNLERVKIDNNVKKILPCRCKKCQANLNLSRKKYNVNSKKQGLLLSKLYFLPNLSLNVKTVGNLRKTSNQRNLKKMANELVCRVCTRVFRTPIGKKVHTTEDHPELTAKEYLSRGTRKKKSSQKDPELVTLESDSALSDIDDLLAHSIASSDDIDDQIQSSDIESQVNIYDILMSSDVDDSISATAAVVRMEDNSVDAASRTQSQVELIDLCLSE